MTKLEAWRRIRSREARQMCGPSGIGGIKVQDAVAHRGRQVTGAIDFPNIGELGV